MVSACISKFSNFFFIRLRVFLSTTSSKNDITTSVFDTFPIDIISKVSLGSLILLRINAVLNTIVSTKPSLEPLNTFSVSGSWGPLTG